MRAGIAPLAALGVGLVLAACSGRQPQNSLQPVAAAPRAAAASPSVRAHGTPRHPEVVPGEFLVKFRIPTDPSYAAAVVHAAAFRIRTSYRSVPGLHLVKSATGTDAARAATALAASPAVEYVEPNFVVHADVVPNDPRFAQQWALQNLGQTGGTSTATPDIGAVPAWDITTGSSSVVVAVIDTGVDYTHPDLTANIFTNTADCSTDGIDHDGDGYVNDCHGINAITKTGDPMDDYFHGTHVAGIIGASGNNAVGVSGVNWNVTLLPCKFLDSTGSGSDADAITCLDYVAMMKDRGVNIIATNNSWGGGGYSRALGDAIVAQREHGILFVVAAGNDSSDNDIVPSYPCTYDLANVICVASTYDFLSVFFSNYGRGTVHLGAPGEAILSTVPNNDYQTYDGTSMATPFVTGVLALLAAQDPTRDWRALKNLVLAGTVPPTSGTIPTLTGGRVHALTALTCQNSVVEARMRPAIFEPITLAIGGSIRLEALNINCANPNGPVVVTVNETGEQVTLVDDGTGMDEVAGDGIYAGTWTAHTAGTFTLTFPGRAGDVVTVNVDAALKSGFPAQTVAYADLNGMVGSALAPLVVGNMDTDPAAELLATGVGGGPLYAWKANGTPVPGWPNYAAPGTLEVSIANLASDASGHAIVASGQGSGVSLYSGSGAPLPGWPQSSSNVWNPAPTVDLDGDGNDEIIIYPARHADGTLLSSLVTVPAMAPIYQQVPGSAAVADLDADGKPDFVVADNLNVYASNVQGLLAGFPVLTPDNSGGGEIYPLIGDVTGDGTPKILLPTRIWHNGYGTMAINILSNQGTLLTTLSTTADGNQSGIALADLDGDGIPEIVASAGTSVYAWKGDGTPVAGWPVTFPDGTTLGPIAVGDVDGSGYPEVVLMSSVAVNGTAPTPAAIQVLDRNGVSRPGFPRPLPPSIYAGTPVIADLDGSGHNLLIIARAVEAGLRDNIFVYDFGGSGTYGPIEWSQYMGGPDHRGYYELGKNLPNDAYLTVQSHGAGTVASGDGAIACGTGCIHRYAKGTSVVLTATPAPGATFSSWYGPCAGQGNPCTVTVSRYTPIAADFASPVAVTLTGTGTGTVTSSPSGVTCPGTCTASFGSRSVVTLTAAPATGDAFAGWSGDCSGLETTCTLVIDSAKSTSARFVDRWQLSLVYTGTGTSRIVSSPAGLDCGTTCSATFAPGTAVTLTATPANDTYITGWGAPGCLNYQLTCTVTMTADTSVVVALAPKPTLSLSLVGNGGTQAVWTPNLATVTPTVIKCSQNCSIPVDPGSLVELDALPGQGATLVGFSGDCVASTTPCYLTLDASKNVTVTFSGNSTLSVTEDGSGTGRVSSSDGQLGCPSTCRESVPSGTSITLTAAPDAASTFDGWSGACSGTATTCVVMLTSDATVDASFKIKPVATQPPSSGGGGGGAVSPATLLALAALGVARLARSRRARLRAAAAETARVRGFLRGG